jgi:GNAT superfamily N-acetyltransferase
VEYQVRDARITDIDRITTLLEGVPEVLGDTGTPLKSADLLRQLVYLPQAVVLVAESQRRIVGVTVLALRASVVEGGFVGTIDVLAHDPEYTTTGVAESLVNEAVRLARNKGCVAVEAIRPEEPEELERWERWGFGPGASRVVRHLTSTVAAR